MKAVTIALLVVLVLANRIAIAENVRDPSSAVPTPGTGNWTVSETTSPVDYTPIVVAVTRSGDGVEGSGMQLNIYCRNGRTELVISGLDVLSHGDNYAVSYRINGNAPVQIGSSMPSFGAGTAFKGDVARLLQSFPEEGAIDVRLVPRTGAAREGHFSLGGLKVVRDKLAAACKWPQVVAKPNN